MQPLDEPAPPLRRSVAEQPASPPQTSAFNPLQSIPPRPPAVKGKRGEWTWNPYGDATEGKVYTYTGRVCACGNILMADAGFCRKCGTPWTERGAQPSEPIAYSQPVARSEPVVLRREPVAVEPPAALYTEPVAVEPREPIRVLHEPRIFQAQARPVEALPHRTATPPSRPVSPAKVIGRAASPPPKRTVSPAKYLPATVFRPPPVTSVFASPRRVAFPPPPKVQPVVYQTHPTTVEKQFVYQTPPTTVEKPIYIETFVEKIVEKIVEKPVYIEKIVERPVYVDKVVDRPVYIDNFVEVERIVEVPQVQVRQVFVDKPVDRPVYIDKVVERYVDRPYPVDRFVDKLVDRPIYIDNFVEVERIVEVPQVQVQQVFVDKPVDRPVYIDKVVDRPYPVERIVDREVQVPVPQPVYIDKLVDRPVYIDKIVEREKIVNVPQVQYQQVVMEKIVDRPVPVDRIVEKPVETIVEREVPVPQTVYVDKYIDRPQIIERVVERIIDRTEVVHVPQVQQVFVEKSVETPVYVDRVVDRVVEQPMERIVEKIVDRPVYVDRVVDRVVEKPIHHVSLKYGAPQGFSSASTQLPSPEFTPPGTAWPGSSAAVLPSRPPPFATPMQTIPIWPPTPMAGWTQPESPPVSARWEPPPPAVPLRPSSQRAVGDIGAWGSLRSGFGSGTLPPSNETLWSPPRPIQPPRSTRAMDMTTTVPMVNISRDIVPHSAPFMSPDEELPQLVAGDDFPYHDPFQGCDFEGRNVEWSSGNFLR